MFMKKLFVVFVSLCFFFSTSVFAGVAPQESSAPKLPDDIAELSDIVKGKGWTTRSLSCSIAEKFITRTIGMKQIGVTWYIISTSVNGEMVHIGEILLGEQAYLKTSSGWIKFEGDAKEFKVAYALALGLTPSELKECETATK